MTTHGFAKALSKRGYTMHDAEVITADFIDTLKEALMADEEVMFTGFGKFYVKVYKDRSYVSRKGDFISNPPFSKPKFSAGHQFSVYFKERDHREGIGVRDAEGQ